MGGACTNRERRRLASCVMPTLGLKGAWTAELSGGCPKNTTWLLNPQYLITPTGVGSFTIDLTQYPAAGATLVPVGVAVLHGQVGEPLRSPILAKQVVGKSKYKSVRTQSLRIELQPAAPDEVYVLIPMTYEPNQLGAFHLTVTTEDAGEFTVEPYSAPTQPIHAGASAGPLLQSLQAADGRAAAPVPQPTPAPEVPPTTPPIAPPVASPTAMLSDAADTAAASDPVLHGAIENYRQTTGGSGTFEDPEFAVRSGGKPDNALLYVAGQPGPNAKKVDSFWRLSQMGGKGDLLAFSPPGSLMVHRSSLQDAWLLSAIGMVSTRRELLAHVLFHSEPQVGLHAVRLFKDGTWTTIVMDDLIPSHGKLKPVYSSNSEPRDGPVLLLQKALAKLYGCYEHLLVGRLGSALEDLTGGVSEKIYLRDGCQNARGEDKQPNISIEAELASGALWVRLSSLLKGGHLLGATYKTKYSHLGGKSALPADLEGGAALAYPILEMREAQGQQLVRLRNPWRLYNEATRAPEWKGAWGVGSSEWQNQPGLATALGGKPREVSHCKALLCAHTPLFLATHRSSPLRLAATTTLCCSSPSPHRPPDSIPFAAPHSASPHYVSLCRSSPCCTAGFLLDDICGLPLRLQQDQRLPDLRCWVDRPALWWQLDFHQRRWHAACVAWISLAT